MALGYNHHQYGPGVHGLASAFDLKQVAATQNLSNVIDLRGVESISIAAIVTITGSPTVGDFKFIAIPYALDGTTQIGDAMDLTALSSAISASEKFIIGMALGNGTPISFPGTPETQAIDAEAALLLTFPKAKIGIEIGTASNATTSTADVYINIRRTK